MPPRPRQRAESAEERLERISGQLAAPPNINRYRPHAKQLAFHSMRVKNRLFLGGNRSGKSVGGTAEGIYRAMGRHPYRPVPAGPTRGRVYGTNFSMGIEKVLLPLWGQWTPPSQLINGSWLDSYHDGKDGKVLNFDNGSMVEFMSYEQGVQASAGASRHWVHFDEEPPEDIYDEARARLIDTDGDWWMTLTPVLGLDFIFDAVYKPGKLAVENPELLTPEMLDGETGLPLFGVVEVESYENTHLKRSALDGYFGTLDEDTAKTRRGGQFVQITGAVFPDYSADRHVMPDDEFKLRHGYHRIYESIDNGWRDHTAVLWHAVDPFGNVTTFDELYVNETLYSDVAAGIKRIRRHWGIDRPHITVGDPTAMKQKNGITGTNPRMEFARLGIPVASEGIERDVEHGIRRMTQYLRHNRDPGYGGWERPRYEFDAVGQAVVVGTLPTPKWLITTRCPNLVRQMSKNRWRRRARASDERSMNKLREIQQTDNHGTDSARFFFVTQPDLAPHETRQRADGRRYAEVADTLGAVRPDSRRDPRATRPTGWRYRPTASEE